MDALSPSSKTQPDSGARSEGARLPELDALRVAAIALVVIYHYPYADQFAVIRGLRSWGWAGVDLFFALSGYLISHRLITELRQSGSIDYGAFFVRRALRIWPAYLATVALYFLVPGFREQAAIAPLWRFLTFTLNFGFDYSKAGSFTHAWSLCIEEHFYLLFPLVLLGARGRVGRKTGLAAFAGLILGGILFRAMAWTGEVRPLLAGLGSPGHGHPASVAFYELLYYPTYAHLDGLVFGVAVACLRNYRPSTWRRLEENSRLVLLAGLALIASGIAVAQNFYGWANSTLGFTLFGAGFAALVARAVLQGDLAAARLPGLRAGADLSYAIYLTHCSLIMRTREGLARLGLANNPLLLLSTTVLVLLAAGWILHRLVERPLLAWREPVISSLLSGKRSEAWRRRRLARL